MRFCSEEHKDPHFQSDHASKPNSAGVTAVQLLIGLRWRKRSFKRRHPRRRDLLVFLRAKTIRKLPRKLRLAKMPMPRCHSRDDPDLIIDIAVCSQSRIYLLRGLSTLETRGMSRTWNVGSSNEHGTHAREVTKAPPRTHQATTPDGWNQAPLPSFNSSGQDWNNTALFKRTILLLIRFKRTPSPLSRSCIISLTLLCIASINLVSLFHCSSWYLKACPSYGR